MSQERLQQLRAKKRLAELRAKQSGGAAQPTQAVSGLAPERQAAVDNFIDTQVKGRTGNFSSFTTGAVRGASLGASDHVMAGLNSLIPVGKDKEVLDFKGNLNAVRQIEDARQAENPNFALAGKIPATIRTAIGAGALKPFQAFKGKGLLAGTAGLGLEGAALAGTEAALNGGDAAGAAKTGGLLGAGANVLTRGIGGKIAGAFKGKKPEVPTTQDLLDGARDTRKQLKDLGAEFSPDQVKQLANGVLDDVPVEGIDRVGGKVGKAARQIVKNAGSPATFEQLDNLRKQIDLPVTASNSDKRLAGLLRGHIDDFVQKVDPASGSGEGLGGLLSKSRDFTKRGRTAEALEGAIQTAKTRTAKSGTGGNLDNNLRSEVDKVLKKQGKFLDSATRKQLEAISRGSKSQNLARSFGRAFSPTTGALQGAASGAGAVATGGLSIPLNIAGIAAKKGSERKTQKNIEDLIRQIQAGSKSAAARPDTKISKALEDEDVQRDLARALSISGLGAFQTR